MSSLGDNNAIIPLAAVAGAVAAPYLFPTLAGAAGAGAAGAGAGAGAAGAGGTMAGLTGPELFMGTAGGANLAGMGAAAVPASAYAMPAGFAINPMLQDLAIQQGMGMLGQGGQQQQQQMPPQQMPGMAPPSFGGRNAPSLAQASGIGVPQLSQAPQTAGMLRRPI